MKDRIFNATATANIYRNEYLLNEEMSFKPRQNIRNLGKKGSTDIHKHYNATILEGLQSKVKSPIIYEEYDEYHALG